MQFTVARLGTNVMQITERQLHQHYFTTWALLREYFPRADQRVVNEYVAALRSYDTFPAPEALNRLIMAQHLIASSIPTVDLEP